MIAQGVLGRSSHVVRGSPTWVRFLVGSLAIAATIPFMPWEARARVYEAISFSGVLAAFVGIRRQRPERLLGWQALAVGTACIAVGDLIFDLYPALRHILAPFPSAADVLWLPGYVMLAVGAWVLFRTSRPGTWKTGWVDVHIAAVALFAALWIFFIDPQLHTGNFDELDMLIAAYPIVDTFLIALACRFLFAPATWGPGLRLFALGACGLAFGDLWYSTALARGITMPSWAVGLGWLLWPIAMGTLALHPAMRAFGTGGLERSGSVPRMRVWMLACLTLVPVWSWAEARLLGVRVDGDVVVLQAVVTALMLFRVGMLLHEVGAHREQLVTRERERAHLLERLTAVADEERTRVSGALHDGPIQHLSDMELGLERARLRIDAGETAEAARLVERVQGQLRDEVLELRRLMADLRPPILTERGLPAALRDHVEALGRRAELQIDMRARLDERIDPEAEAVLFRVAQESLTNVVHHAHATHVWLTVERRNGHVELIVRDDGLGFDPTRSVGGRPHYGLEAVRERVAMALGTLEVRSRPGAGTVVYARVPVKREDAP